MLKIVLIRHGKTAGNLKGCYIGTTDESLCSEGSAVLKEAKYPAVEAVYVSPMKRCMETAALLYRDIPIKKVEDFKECDFGEFENKNYIELTGNPKYQAWVDSLGTLPFPGGESSEVFSKRTRVAFVETLEAALKSGYRSIALVVHGGTIMSILEKWGTPAGDFYHWQVKNGKGFILETDIDLWNREKKLRVAEKF